MAYEVNDLRHTLLCSTGLQQYSIVGLSTSGVLMTSTNSTGFANIGVITSEGTTASTVESYQTFQFGGVAKVRTSTASTSIIPGTLLKASTVSASKGAASTCTSTNAPFAIALQAVGATTGAIISALLLPTLRLA